MADYKYLNETGLKTLWSKIKGRVVILDSAEISTSVAATVGTIVVNNSTGAAWVVLTASGGKAATWKKLSEGELSTLKTAIEENSDAISDIISSIGVYSASGKNIVKANSPLTDGQIIVGDDGAGVTASGVTIEGTLTATDENKIATSKGVAAYVNQQIENAMEADVKTYVANVEGTFTANEINAQLAKQTADVEISYTSAKSLKVVDGSGTKDVELTKLKPGDVVLIKETGYPDRWVSSNSYEPGTGTTSFTITFSKLETQNLDVFLQKPNSTLIGSTSQTITSLGADSDGKLTATFSNISLGLINSNGQITADSSLATLGTYKLLLSDVSKNGGIIRSPITINTGTGSTTKFLSQAGTWATVDLSTAILKSLLTAKGQIIYSSAASTPQVLSAPSVASGSAAILSFESEIPAWSTITPITDATINALD